MEAQVAALHQVQHQVQRVTVLEGEVHVDHEGRTELGQQHALVHHALHALLRHHATYHHTYIDFSISFIAY